MKQKVGDTYPLRFADVVGRVFALIDMARGQTTPGDSLARSDMITSLIMKGVVADNTCEAWKQVWVETLAAARKALEEE